MDYRNKAVNCVKNTVLPIQAKQFKECGCSLNNIENMEIQKTFLVK